nr:MAG TPA: hypothetical protein [Caudoviricetes sp.]
MKKENRNKYKLGFARTSPFYFLQIRKNRKKIKPRISHN